MYFHIELKILLQFIAKAMLESEEKQDSMPIMSENYKRKWKIKNPSINLRDDELTIFKLENNSIKKPKQYIKCAIKIWILKQTYLTFPADCFQPL